MAYAETLVKEEHSEEKIYRIEYGFRRVKLPGRTMPLNLVLAVAYFSARWLGQSLKLNILSTHVLKAARRFFGIPDFHYYALADGIGRLLCRLPFTTKFPPS